MLKVSLGRAPYQRFLKIILQFVPEDGGLPGYVSHFTRVACPNWVRLPIRARLQPHIIGLVAISINFLFHSLDLEVPAGQLHKAPEM